MKITVTNKSEHNELLLLRANGEATQNPDSFVRFRRIAPGATEVLFGNSKFPTLFFVMRPSGACRPAIEGTDFRLKEEEDK